MSARSNSWTRAGDLLGSVLVDASSRRAAPGLSWGRPDIESRMLPAGLSAPRRTVSVPDVPPASERTDLLDA